MSITCEECNGTGTIEEPELEPYRGHRYKLSRGWRKTWLMHKIARSETSHSALARALGVSHQAVMMFARRHAEEIAEIRTRLEDEFVTLWIADKINRLAEIQQDVEDVNTVIGSVFDPKDADAALAECADIPQWIRLKHAALRAVAEELGQIPNKSSVQVEGEQKLTYNIVGVDMSKV